MIQEQECMFICSDFYEGYGEKMGFVGLSFLSSPLVIPSTWSKDWRTSRDNGRVKTKDFIDEYPFILCMHLESHWIVSSARKDAGDGTFSF